MSLADLPTELLGKSLAYLIPNGWNKTPTDAACLELRLVCRRFDDIVSYYALRTLDFRNLRKRSWRPNDSRVKWLAVTKLKADRRKQSRLAVAVWGSILSIQLWRIRNSEPSQDDVYINAAVGILIANWGQHRVCKQLVASSTTSSYSESPDVKALDDLTWGPCPDRQRLIEAMAHFNSLHVAAYRGDGRIVEVLLENDINPNLSSEYFGSALYAAAFSGHTDMARLLIDRGAALDSKGFLGTPLEAAAQLGHVQMLQLLLERWPSANGNDMVNRCLVYASKNGHKRAVQLLLERDVDLNAGKDIGQIPPVLADQIRRPNSNISDRHCYTPLFTAAEHGHDDVVRLLLARSDLNPNLGPNFCGIHDTPLGIAVHNGHETTVKLLLENRNTNPNKVGGLFTPLCVAAEDGRTEIMRLLLERFDTDINLKDANGMAPLAYAARQGDASVVQLLLSQRCIDPNIGDNAGKRPLLFATQENHHDIVRLLLDHPKTCPNICANDGETCLLTSSMEGYGTIVKHLLNHIDIDPNLACEDWTPLHRAVNFHRTGIVRLLLQHPNIKLDLALDDGTTALMMTEWPPKPRLNRLFMEKLRK
ncbi:ankyrin repeat-containing domain protein [Xylaria digitata]|nr:ankyrin repeat-containing domain protein [Xylaria digitata]